MDNKLLFSVDELNRFFSSPSSVVSTAPNDSVYFLGDSEYSDTKFYWKHIEPQHVVRALRGIKSEAVGEDGVAPKLIRLALPCVLPAITHIFNFCLETGVYSDL